MDMHQLEADRKSPKPNGEFGYVIKFDSNQESFKKALIVIAFAAAYLEAIFYIIGTQNFGNKYKKEFDNLNYERKLELFGVKDVNLIKAAERLRNTRNDLVHEKAKNISKIEPKDFRFAQEEAIEAFSLVKQLNSLLIQKT